MSFLPCEARDGALQLLGGARITLPEGVTDSVPEGTVLEIGIRPEDLSIVPTAAKGTLSGRVDVVQETGSSRLIHVETEAGPLTASQPASAPRPEGNVVVAPRQDGFLLFDKGSGARLF